MIIRHIAPTLLLLAAGVSAHESASAADFIFDTPPFAGTTALETPGRQIIGNELFIPLFDFAADRLAFNLDVFGVPSPFAVFNGNAASLPANQQRIVVLRDFDGDGNPDNGIALNAGLAANLIAAQPITPGAGFFIYFNSGLELPRLVFSTDLASADADLKVLARFTGLGGSEGRDALALFTNSNFGAVPEPASWAMFIARFGLIGSTMRRRGHRSVPA